MLGDFSNKGLTISHESPGKNMKRGISHKEGNVLFNDALNTFYLWLYGVRHMVKNHSISSKGSFICTSHRQDSTYHGLCYTSRGALAGMRNTLIKCSECFISGLHFYMHRSMFSSFSFVYIYI